MKCDEPASRSGILRLARTVPRKDSPGIGLPCFYFSNLSNRETLILTKSGGGDAFEFKEHVSLVQVDYQDLVIGREHISKTVFFLVAMSKIWGETRMLVAALREIKRRKFKPAVIHVHSTNYLISGSIIGHLVDSPVCVSIGGTEIRRLHKNKVFRFFFEKSCNRFLRSV